MFECRTKQQQHNIHMYTLVILVRIKNKIPYFNSKNKKKNINNITYTKRKNSKYKLKTNNKTTTHKPEIIPTEDKKKRTSNKNDSMKYFLKQVKKQKIFKVPRH